MNHRHHQGSDRRYLVVRPGARRDIDDMQSERHLYTRFGFERSPTHDHLASDIFGSDKSRGDVLVMAYQRSVAARFFRPMSQRDWRQEFDRS